MKKPVLTCLVFCTLVVGCAEVTCGRPKSERLEGTVIEAGLYGRLSEEGALVRVTTDRDAYQAAYREIHSGAIPPPEPPAVNFEESVVVFLILDEKPTAGWSLSFEEASISKGELDLTLTVTSPRPGMLTAQVITRPYLVLRLPKVTFNSLKAKTGDGRVIVTWKRPS